MRQEFTQEIKNAMDDYLRDIHTVIPAKIVTFDADKCEAQVQPTAKYWRPDGELIDFPEIFEVPVRFIQGIGQKATICHAVEPGDECLLHIAEQALDYWRTGAESPTDLRFDITNAVAVVGFFSEPNPLVKRACDNKSIIIQREETFIELFDKKIEVYTDGDIYEEADLTINSEAGIDINIKAGADIAVEAGGDVSVTAGGNISVTADGNMALEAAGDITLKASAIHLN